MKYLVVTVLTFIILVSCNSEYKTCEFESSDEQIKIYNNILNELVDHYFYNFYLGKHEERIFELSAIKDPDTSKIKKEVIKIQNELFHDSSRFCTIYLDTIFRPQFDPWKYYLSDTSSYTIDRREIISQFSTNGSLVIDSLNAMQANIKPKDFHLCTSRVASLADLKKEKDRCAIGVVAFSKVFLSKSGAKGILYCSFRCGGLCGKGMLLTIEKTEDRRIIIDGRIEWIS